MKNFLKKLFCRDFVGKFRSDPFRWWNLRMDMADYWLERDIRIGRRLVTKARLWSHEFGRQTKKQGADAMIRRNIIRG